MTPAPQILLHVTLPGFELPTEGYFTGRLRADAAGRIIPEVSSTKPAEGHAYGISLAQIFVAPNESIAARVAGMLFGFGPIGIDIRMVPYPNGAPQ